MKKKRGLNNKAQMKMSFGMIFSLILIMAFLAFGFYAIKFLLDLQNTTKIGTFIDEFEEDVDGVWKSTQGSKKESYNIPGKIEYVCFFKQGASIRGRYQNIYDEFEIVPQPGDNMYFYPLNAAGELNVLEIEHLDTISMTSQHNPYCIKNTNSKIEMVLKKDFGENLVKIINPDLD